MTRTIAISLHVNDRPVDADVEPRTTLADFLRTTLALTGTHLGCEHGVCGACNVLLDGQVARSCLMLAVQADGQRVVTVEGLSPGAGLSALQQAFKAHHALQCGFCTPGFLVSAHALLQEEPSPSRERIVETLSGNLCRCTGYIPIVDAVEAVARQRGAGDDGDAST
jgi:carbon-monoxide dehydrogenase small subunit